MTGWTRWIVATAAVALCSLASPSSAQEHNGQIDVEKVIGPETCGECHVSAYEVWKKTTHATGFRTLHRKESATEIAKRLDIKLIKRGSVCLDCHYAPTRRNGQLRADSGVSCESCHGAARDWIDVHNDYGPKGTDHRTETAEHRQQRLATSRAAGMRDASDLYDLASTCYECHTVPRERLINVGRHSLGSSGFELVAWSQGDIRHNFLDSFRDGDGTINAEISDQRRRQMYVVGRALELEHALRGVAAASAQGVYVKAMQRRVRDALTELRAVEQVTGLPEVTAMLDSARTVRVSLGKQSELRAAADRVGQATRRFLSGHDGSQLASVDVLVEGGADAIDLIEEEDDAFDEPVLADGGPAVGTESSGANAGTTTAANGPAGGGTTTAASSETVISAIPAVGTKRDHIRPRRQQKTLAVSACQKCHGDQNAWWFDDAHSTSVDRLLDRTPQASQIARLYGISPSKMARGTSLCSDCHATVASGREKREAQDGVSCQSCHGPGAQFLEPHQEGELSQGRQRPGYRKALQLGMIDLRDVATRMRNCASCHYVTDQRLLSSGHPSGAEFDIVAAMSDIRHWQAPVEAAGELRSSYGTVLAERGPVPQVTRARLATTRSTGAASTASARTPAEAVGGRRTRTFSSSDASGDGATRSRVFRPRPAGARGGSGAAASPIELPEMAPIDPNTPIEDLLLWAKKELETLYRRLAGSPEGDGS